MAWKHRLTNINTDDMTAECAECGPVQIRPYYRKSGGYRCKMKYFAQYGTKNGKYRKYRKDYCERCGFTAENPVQLDIDHKDNNHSNNDPSNLQTLCANCHRLVTWLRLQQSGTIRL